MTRQAPITGPDGIRHETMANGNPVLILEDKSPRGGRLVATWAACDDHGHAMFAVAVANWGSTVAVPGVILDEGQRDAFTDALLLAAGACPVRESTPDRPSADAADQWGGGAVQWIDGATGMHPRIGVVTCADRGRDCGGVTLLVRDLDTPGGWRGVHLPELASNELSMALSLASIAWQGR